MKGTVRYRYTVYVPDLGSIVEDVSCEFPVPRAEGTGSQPMQKCGFLHPSTGNEIGVRALRGIALTLVR
jgi:hypothetical protein